MKVFKDIQVDESNILMWQGLIVPVSCDKTHFQIASIYLYKCLKTLGVTTSTFESQLQRIFLYSTFQNCQRPGLTENHCWVFLLPVRHPLAVFWYEHISLQFVAVEDDFGTPILS